jgi:hypothetical protein
MWEKGAKNSDAQVCKDGPVFSVAQLQLGILASAQYFCGAAISLFA